MNLVGIRDALVGHLEDNWPHAADVPLFYENKTEVDLDSVGDYFAKVYIDIYGSRQASLGLQPLQRHYGRVKFELFCREGRGVRQKFVYLDSFNDLFKFKAIGGVTTEAPTPSRTEDHDGWHMTTMIVPFFADSSN